MYSKSLTYRIKEDGFEKEQNRKHEQIKLQRKNKRSLQPQKIVKLSHTHQIFNM